ncbi:hypothetical protein [Sphingomonas sp. MMS24-J13]|uniref:hypothetical protein n=1 Tax=Sphingomonas sp. MMS24-J13 TaxID=3238686 RepID=UPI00384D1783
MADDRLTAEQIRDLLATLLAGAVGREPAAWLDAIGPITIHDIVWRPRCNWSVEPKGSRAQIAAIEKAVAIVAAEHPYARADS